MTTEAYRRLSVPACGRGPPYGWWWRFTGVAERRDSDRGAADWNRTRERTGIEVIASGWPYLQVPAL